MLASDPDWKGSKYNVQVESETGEITFEPLSIIAADDPVTCAAYAKEHDLLALEGWRRFRSLAKKDKVLARAIKQSKIRQVRRSQTYMFGYLIPRNYMEAMQFDSENKNSKWYDAMKLEMESMSEYKVFKKWDKAILDKHKKVIQFPPEMDENWVRYGLAKLGQISGLPNWQRMLFCAYTTQLLHSTGEVCWNNKDSYFIWFEFVCRNSGQIASRRSWKRSCLGLEYTSKCSRLALLWEPN